MNKKRNIVLHKTRMDESMVKSIKNVVEQYYDDALDHFCESYTAGDEVIYEEFICRIKEHCVYDLIVIAHHNNEKLIQEQIMEIYTNVKDMVEGN